MKSISSLAIGSLSVLLASATLASCSGNKGQQMEMPAPAIATVTLAPQNVDLQSTYPATIKGKTDIDIRPQVTGFITKVHVDEGQRVRKGQALFTLDQVHAENSLQQANAQLATAKAALVNAQKNLAYTVVTSPSDGVVGQIPNREGSLASPSSAQPLTTVSDNSQVYAYFSLTEKDLLALSGNGKGSLDAAIKSMPAVRLKLSDGTIFPIEGKVATVSGVIDNNTGSSSVRALFSNPDGVLRSGATGQIIIPSPMDSVLVIPQKATFELQDRRFVYVVNDSNKVVSTPIAIETNNDGKVFVVTSGLKADDRVAIEGVGTKLKDGMTINPTAAAPAPDATAAPAAEKAE